MASSFRMGRSGRGWIPAFAGMTGVRTPLTNTEQLPLWYRYVTMGPRSLDMPARLKASVREEPLDAGKLLARLRLRRESIGQIDLREETLREMRDAGRP